MKNPFRMGVENKILGLVLLLIAAGFGGFAVLTSSRQESELVALQRQLNHSLALAVHASLKTSMVEGKSDLTQKALASLRGMEEDRIKVFDRSGAEVFSDGGKADPAEMEQLLKALGSGEVVSFYEGDGAGRTLNEIHPLRNEAACQACHDSTEAMRGAILISSSTQGVDSAVRSSRLVSVAALLLTLALLTVALKVGLKLAFFTPLKRVVGGIKRIAAGDLTRSSDDLTDDLADDEIGELAGAFVQMQAQLRELHQAIEGAVQKLAAGSAEIFAAVQEQEAASQTQSSGAEEVSATMTSLLEAAVQIAEAATGVSANAEGTKETSAATAKKIAELTAQTNRMVEILEIIREIADRSDLLALNASLEGTRAGEAGRGFSLVANEMRRLSERVTSSVQDVKVLVSDIRASGASTVMITEEARKLAEGTAISAKQITLVTQQQRTATELVSKSLSEVARVLLQSVAANRQTKAAAQDLKVQAEGLATLTRRFQVEVAGK